MKKFEFTVYEHNEECVMIIYAKNKKEALEKLYKMAEGLTIYCC